MHWVAGADSNSKRAQQGGGVKEARARGWHAVSHAMASRLWCITAMVRVAGTIQLMCIRMERGGGHDATCSLRASVKALHYSHGACGRHTK